MKILICAYQEAVNKQKTGKKIVIGPRVLNKRHIQRIKAVAEDLEIAVTADPKEAMRYAADADIIAGFPRTIPAISRARNLKWIHSFSAGMDRVLTPAIIRSPILVSNSSGIHKIPIAEHVLGYMLIFCRGFLRSLENQKKRLWEKDDSITELRGKTVLVVGLGNIGGEVARLAHALGCRVIAVTRSTRERIDWVHDIKKSAMLDQMLSKADFVVSCLPHTKETHHLFMLARFRKMKRSAIFVNIGRGGLVREKDLIAALKKKVIAGAALDVTEIEPLPSSSPLWRMSNVIITPHHSATSEYSLDRSIDRFCLNLKAFLIGDRLPNLVDKKLGY